VRHAILLIASVIVLFSSFAWANLSLTRRTVFAGASRPRETSECSARRIELAPWGGFTDRREHPNLNDEPYRNRCTQSDFVRLVP